MLAALSRMGHGDELVLADAHFPAESRCRGAVVLRADGVPVAPLLRAILPLFELDSYGGAPLIGMAAVPGDGLDPAVEASWREEADRAGFGWAEIARLERFAFYERAAKAFLVVQTGETRQYGNLILRKGVVPVVPEPAPAGQRA